jgi:hypothetical protein
VLVLRRGESWDGWLAAVWERKGGMGKKKGKKKEKQRKRVSAEWDILAFTNGIIDGHVPSVIPSVKVSRHCTAIPV